VLHRCWIARKRTIRNLFFLFGSVASITTLFFGMLPDPTTYSPWEIFFLAISAFFVCLIVVFEIRERPKNRVFKKGDDIGILNYMHDWIKHGGRIAIWTRDMSWANNVNTKRILTAKAEDGELIIMLPTKIPLSQELADAGAEVFYYSNHRLDPPSSRFTIANFGKGGSSVAVGSPHGDTHIIEEYNSGDHPAYDIANDLVKLAQSVSGSNNDQSS